MKIVETVKKTYIAAEVEEKDDAVQLKKAVVINPEESDNEIARAYVRGTLIGKVANISLKAHNVESIQEADEAGPLIDLMMKYLPLAEKNAKANSILIELDKLIGTDTDKADDYNE